MEPHRHDAQADRLLAWLEQADRSSGDRKPVLAVGRDGLMLPIRGQACYREGATATVSVYDRRGQRLGTVYLGRMPEPGQETLSRQLTALIEAVLRGWAGPSPRLAYITDGGNHQTRYYRRVLRRMSDPHHPGRRLKWHWVIDYYHACEYITKLSEALFSDAGGGELGAEDAPVVEGEAAGDLPGVALGGGPPAAADHRVGGQAEQYRTAYAYLRKRMRWSGLPGLSPGPPADRQRGDGGGVQDGVHPAAEAVGDDVESGERPVDRRPSGDPLERGLERGVSILPGIERHSNGDSRDYSEKKSQMPHNRWHQARSHPPGESRIRSRAPAD